MNIKNIKEGKYTAETFAKYRNISRQSAINLLSRLKKSDFVKVSGGGKQKRIYTISRFPEKKTNGFYDIVNKYSPEKLLPKFKHYVTGNYTIEHALIDGLKIGDIRTKEATIHLFRHVKNWKLLFSMARKNSLEKELLELYRKARATIKCRRIPRRYLR